MSKVSNNHAITQAHLIFLVMSLSLKRSTLNRAICECAISSLHFTCAPIILFCKFTLPKDISISCPCTKKNLPSTAMRVSSPKILKDLIITGIRSHFIKNLSRGGCLNQTPEMWRTENLNLIAKRNPCVGIYDQKT